MLCFVKRDGDVHSDYTTPEPQQVGHLHPQLVQQRCSQLNITQVSFFFFLAGETASLTGGWMPLHTVFHLFSCWSSGCRLRAQQMAFRGDLHMQLFQLKWKKNKKTKNNWFNLLPSQKYTYIDMKQTKQATVRNLYVMHFQNENEKNKQTNKQTELWWIKLMSFRLTISQFMVCAASLATIWCYERESRLSTHAVPRRLRHFRRPLLSVFVQYKCPCQRLYHCCMSVIFLLR